VPRLLDQQILSDISVFGKYARYLPERNRRENWDELVDRRKKMDLDYFRERLDSEAYAELAPQIERVFEDFVRSMKVLPSMRSMQFAGPAIFANQVRGFNCSYLPLSEPEAFREIMFLLLSGTGVGYSVQSRHVSKLPPIRQGGDVELFTVPDSIEGWADAVDALIQGYTGRGPKPVFDYSQVRPKGARLVTSGGKAPGPEPLRNALERVEALLQSVPDGERLTSVQAHDIACHLAHAVLSGGIRRAAMISLFDANDEAMLAAKAGAWWEQNAQRARSNNSAVLHRQEHTREDFQRVWDATVASKAGEPGIFWTDDFDFGVNPCAEISLRAYEMCNLCEINASTVESEHDLLERAAAASFIGTLQAAYTNFHYLRPMWRETCEAEALIGVGATGIASGNFTRFDLERAAEVVKTVNEQTAQLIGINPAARTTCVKPSGTTSTVLGTSSGIHAWHAPFYIRRVRLNKTEALYAYVKDALPALVEDDTYDPTSAVLSVPQRAPEGATTRSESAMDFLARVSDVYRRWVRPGHRVGANVNNVSATVSYRDHEVEAVGEWLWAHREEYTGLSMLPASDHTYVQAPFEDIDEGTYWAMREHLSRVDLREVVEVDDDTDVGGEAACSAGSCEVTFV
jgi:ribonucleoside-triphosphate reductase (thioredoxin)